MMTEDKKKEPNAIHPLGPAPSTILWWLGRVLGLLHVKPMGKCGS